MPGMENPGALAGATGASDSVVERDGPEPSNIIAFSQPGALSTDLPAGLDPDSIIARHFWRADDAA